MPPIKSHSTAVDVKSTWNGPTAMSKAPQDATILRYMTAWYAGENPNQKGSYKFPHHEGRLNSPANIKGVNNALARLSQAKIPSGDRAVVEAHLRKHRKDAGLEEAMSDDDIALAINELISEGVIQENDEAELKRSLLEYESVYRNAYPMFVSLGLPMSFEELDQSRANAKKMQTIDGLYSDLWELFSNVMRESLNSVDQLDALKLIFDAFLVRAEAALTDEEVQESNRIQENFTIIPTVLDDLLAEGVGANGMRSPLKVKMSLVEPGWGNTTMNRYYPPDVLRRDAHVFEGVKVYRTGHNVGERTERDEVATIDKILGFSQSGAPLAEVTIFDPDTAEKTRNRALAEKLNTLEASILGSGNMTPFELDGRKGYRVNAIKKGISFDFVTKAGAGAQAVSLLSEDGQISEKDVAEMEEKIREENKTVEDKTKIAEQESIDDEKATTPEVKPDEAVTKEDNGPDFLTQAQVQKVLSESALYQNLPAGAKLPLSLGVWLSEESLTQAIAAQVDALKSLTGAGKAPNLSENSGRVFVDDETVRKGRLSEDEIQAEYDALYKSIGA